MIEIPERRECCVNGAAISYLEAGQGEPFLMIHGMMSNAVDFLFQFRDFAGGFRCIAPDLRGHGMSRDGGADSLSLAQAVEDMRALIAELAPGGKITLMGHSYGGMVALELLSAMPERFRRLIIVASPAEVASKPHARVGLALLNAVVPAVTLLISRGAIDFYTKWINIPPWNLNGDLRELLRLRNELISAEDLAALVRYFESVKDWRVPDFGGGAAATPALLIYGRDDLLVKRRNMKKLARALPNSRARVVNGARHSPLNEKPEVFNGLLREFFEET